MLFFEIGLDALQSGDAFTFQIPLACPRKNRFGRKTMLNPQPVFYDALQSFTLFFRHA